MQETAKDPVEEVIEDFLNRLEQDSGLGREISGALRDLHSRNEIKDAKSVQEAILRDLDSNNEDSRN